MARGKQTCKILKEIRRQIAEANDIDFITSECQYKGDCLGSCPKCEAEVRYLERQLRARSIAGESIALVGISAGLIMSGCGSSASNTDHPGDNQQGEPVELTQNVQSSDTITRTSPDSAQNNGAPDLSLGKPDLNIVVGGVDEGRDNMDTCSHDSAVRQDSSSAYDKDNVIFGAIESDPQFPGGQRALLDWVQTNMVYPPSAIEAGKQGKVIVQFVVKSDGTIGETKVVRSKSEDLDNEALRIVRSLPRFTPGTLSGVPTDVWYTLPIIFKLPDESGAMNPGDS